jgi:hypothetical protein
MTLLISQILPDVLPFSPVLSATLVSICLIALFASNLQSVFSVTILVKLPLVFPLDALCAELLLATIDGTMRFPIFVISLGHSLAAEPISISQSLSQKPRDGKFVDTACGLAALYFCHEDYSIQRQKVLTNLSKSLHCC